MTKQFIKILEQWDWPGSKCAFKPLTEAIRSKARYELIETFVEAGADVGFNPDKDGRLLEVSHDAWSLAVFYNLNWYKSVMRDALCYPLLAAVLRDDYKIAQLLLRHGANPRTKYLIEEGSVSMRQDNHYEPPLHMAKSCDMAVLLLDHGAEIDARNLLMFTAFEIAVMEDAVDMALLLLGRGADRYFYHHRLKNWNMRSGWDPTEEKISALHYAIGHDQWEMIEALINAGFDVEGSENEFPPIFVAAINGDLKTIQKLYDRGAGPLNFYRGDSILHITDDDGTARKLLSLGADLHAKDKHCRTPLMKALDEMFEGSVKKSLLLIEVYVEAGADISASHPQMNSVLTWSMIMGRRSLLRLLISRCNILEEALPTYWTLSHFSHQAYCAEMVILALETWPGLFVKNGTGYADPLLHAIKFRCPAIIEKIVARMRKVESSKPDFGAFLVHVVEFGEPEILSAVLKLLANSSSLGRNVNEAIFTLIAGNHKDLIGARPFLKVDRPRWMKDVSLRKLTRSRNTEKDLQMLEILQDYGADVANATWEGMGILHCAVWRDCEPLMTALLAAGASPFVKDPFGHTPAWWAAKMSRHNMEGILREGEARDIERM